MKPRTLAWIPLAVVLAGVAFAEDAGGDDPNRGVARISVINGEVSVRRGDSGEVVAAALNAPLVVEDRLLTGAGARAEVQFDYANMIRVGPHAEIRFSELAYRRYQMQVAVGTVTYRVLRDSDAQAEISTPNVSVHPVKKGAYRITVREDGSSEITVRSGEAEVYTPRGSERLSAGKTMLARGTAADPEFQIVAARGYDDWDHWNESRDRDLDRSRSYQYVSPDVYGADDLDPYGRWVYDPPYGWVWAPRVAAGWAPYRYGRWAWVDYYGWSWVSYDPWGWAPYHYGRWYWGGYGWCWYPGVIHTRHYWRPALVAFFGWGSYGGFHSSFGFGFGNVGWVPLAPFEPFYPWYGPRFYSGYRNVTVVNRTTIVNNTNITNIYRNSRINNAITSVNSGDFGRTRVGDANVVRVSGRDLQGAGLVRGQLPVTPARDSLRLSDREVRGADLPRTRDDSRFFARREPVRVERVPFEDQRRGVEQVARRTFGDAPIRASVAAEGGAGTRTAAPSGVVERGGGRAAEPGGRTEPSRRAEPPATGPENRDTGTRGEGWRRFGEPGGGAQRQAEQPGRTDVPGGRSAQRGRGEDRGAGGRGFDPGNQSGAAPLRQDRAIERSPAPAPSERRAEGGRDEGWRRFEGSRPSESPRNDSFRNDSPRIDSPRRAEPPAPRPERFQPSRSESPRIERSPDPVRISPPIVRERSTPRSEGGGARVESHGGGGGGTGMRGGGGGQAGGGGGGRGGESRSGGEGRGGRGH